MNTLLLRSMVLAFALAGLPWPAPGAGAQQTNRLDALKTIRQGREQVILAQYGKALDAAMLALKQKGDLDAYMVVEAEKKRFESGKTIPALADAKDAFRPAVEAYYAATEDLLRKYAAALDGLVKQLMLDDKISEAREAKAEKDAADYILAALSKPAAEDAAGRAAETNAPPAARESAAAEKQPGPAGKSAPDDAEEFKGHHYKVFADGANWNKATARCLALGGHLAVITDAEENDFIRNLLHGQTAWIGAAKDLGAWRWCNGTRFEYQNMSAWAAEQAASRGSGDKPRGVSVQGSIIRGLKACINGGGRWDALDGDNASVKCYVCEWDY